MQRSRSFCISVAAFLLATCGTALSQNVVDNSNCEAASIHCPKEGEPSYKKYCCLESDGGYALYSCCNPYLGLIIGVSVGIPIIILIVVAVVIAYCMCHYYHNRKMRSLLETYHRRRREEERRRQARFLAPPPYSHLTEDDVDPNSTLPAYTEMDPYATTSLNSPAETENGGLDTNEEGSTPQLENESAEVVSGEVSSSDQAPLLDESREQ